ncbi:glucoside xylosyltransferase 1 [Lingula anatina]|uniref:UDP-D-xylose:beta-D-glucoside alpha-1,3-D-xylosyltransferase n=1 Tax=Lingula anatina TaxID=7574 RepID=A0A2R2MLX5_LINAN|nr:glucoside xylosyltransferase 1 [Lingula anatina]|eukprot:XP_023931216.1 glucoside xylosyltransferase 1 [Lingula anatina]
MHLAVVACGDRLEETLVMIKSALILSRNAIKVHIFAEYDLHLGFKQQLDKWTAALQDTFTYQLYPITYPEENSFEEWKNLKANKPCVTQRLFLPTLLEDVDSVLYVDTDILFLRPFVDLWNFFKYFNSSHIAALAPERMHRLDGYDHFVLLPHYGLKGKNIKAFTLSACIIVAESLANFQKVFELTCDWNYRPDCCMYASVCKDAEKEGISVLHGNRRMYHNDKQPPFNAVYEAFRKYTMGQDLRTGLLEQMKMNLDKGPKSNCGYVKHIFIKQIEKQITLLEGRKKVFELTCDWNYRPDCCMYASVCKDAEKEGISVLHGNRRMYHNDKQPPFNAVYEAFRKYTMGQDLRTGLLEQMKMNLDKGPKSNCGYVKHIFIKQIEKQITLLEGRS